ncbi:MAG TPA: shikimate kinase [Rickettsiales bacterium]|nr:shikimate kinase [Rickettsiales bacterium]
MEEKIHPSNRKTIILIGMMGAGKTTTGFTLAQRLNIKFIDSDREIEKVEGMSVVDIFNVKGEEYFKKLERKTIAKILNSHQPQVLSIGGSAFDDKDIRDIIKEKAISVFLDVEFNTLLERVKRKNTRPVLEQGNKEEILKEIFDKKMPIYKEADITINTTYLNRDTSINVIMASIAQYIREFDEK